MTTKTCHPKSGHQLLASTRELPIIVSAALVTRKLISADAVCECPAHYLCAPIHTVQLAG